MSTSGVNNSTSGTSGTGSKSSSQGGGLNNVDTNAFIQMLVTELQQQDPTKPMDSSEIMTQVGQIQSIQSTQQLSTTLSALQLSQAVTTANTMIGRQIEGIDTNNQKISGVVSSVTVAGGNAVLNVGNSTVNLNNVSSITSDSASSSATTNNLLNYLAQLLSTSYKTLNGGNSTTGDTSNTTGGGNATTTSS